MKCIFIFLHLFIIALGAYSQQATLPPGTKQLSPTYRSLDGLLWSGIPGSFYSFYTKQKVDSLISSSGGNIDALTLAEMQAGTSTDNKLVSAKNLYDWVNGLGFINVGSNISLLNNNTGYIVGGTGASEVRTNTELDLRYLRTELDPTVPEHVKTIASGDISNWNSKLSSVVAGSGISIDATDPYNPIISASGQSLTFTGDVTGAGTGVIELTLADDSVKTQHLADTAVTTGKIRDGAVTLEKMADMSRGKLLGLASGGVNTWTEYTADWTSRVWAANWTPSTVVGPTAVAQQYLYWYNNVVYSPTQTPTLGVPPPEEMDKWVLVQAGVYGQAGHWTSSYDFPANAITRYNYPGVGLGFYQTSAPTTGISPSDTPVNTPGAPQEISIGSGLQLTVNGVLQATGQAAITNLVVAGAGLTRTGLGTTANPYVFAATGGGSGSSTFAGLSDVNISSIVNGQTVIYSNGDMIPADLPSYGTFSRSVSGLVPAPGGSGTVRYLREDGTWVEPPGSGGSSFRLRSGSNAYLSNDVTLVAGTNVTLSQSGQNITINATGGGGGSVSLVTAGSSTVGAVRYAGVTKTNGQWYGGITDPTNSTRLNFDGVIHAGGVVTYGLSDSTKKEDVVAIDSALKKVHELSGYRFKWKEGDDNYSGYDYGLIAQEVEKVLPEAVVDRDGVKFIKNGNQVIALLLEAVKDLSDKVDDMESKFKSLDKRIKQIENGL